MHVEPSLRQRVFEDLHQEGVLQGGFFRVDAEGRVVDMDAGVRQLWCIQVGQPWYEATFYPERARQWFFETVGRGHGKVPMKTWLLRGCPKTSKGRSYFWGRLFFYPADQGWLGYVLDRTGDEVCRRLQRIPVGFYVVARDPEGVERVVYATQGFADLYQFPSVEAAIETPIVKLFRHEEDYEKFLHELRTRTPHRLQGWKNETRTAQGEPRHISADIAWHLEGEGKDAQIAERYGILRDLTKSEFYTSYLRDYAVVLHTYSNALLEMLNVLSVLKIPMLPDPFKDLENTSSILEHAEYVHHWFHKTRQPVLAALRDLLSQAEARGLQDDIEVRHMQRYYERLRALDEHLDLPSPRFIASVHLEIGSRILRRTQRLREQRPRHGPWFSKEVLRRVRATAWDMVRIASLLVIYPLAGRLIELGDEIRLFREFWNTPLRRYQPKDVNLVDVLEGVLQALSDFAHSRGVRWKRLAPWPRAAWVRADPAALRRALSHLVHNAVKYSWQRASGTWVALRLTQEARAGQAGWLLEIENYGVPIPPDELQDGTIFQFAYRGRLAPDRHRLGTGIGLYDAYRVIRDLEGNLTLTSDPASPIAPDEDPLYEVDPATGERKLRPHLVRARVWLPATAQT